MLIATVVSINPNSLVWNTCSIFYFVLYVLCCQNRIVDMYHWLVIKESDENIY
jgi:hypothetical protein